MASLAEVEQIEVPASAGVRVQTAEVYLLIIERLFINSDRAVVSKVMYWRPRLSLLAICASRRWHRWRGGRVLHWRPVRLHVLPVSAWVSSAYSGRLQYRKASLVSVKLVQLAPGVRSTDQSHFR